jgi:diguanylate cyclase (GGDEF)-like protein
MDSAPQAAVTHLQALLRVARLARGSDLASALPEIATVVGDALGYGVVVVNLYRPAWDDLEVVAVHGGDEARELLLGTSSSREVWLGLLDERYLARGAYFLPHGAIDWGNGFTSFVPELPVHDDPGAWHPEDGLMVAMRDADDGLLAVLSVDEPRSHRRPGAVELDFLVATAGYVGAAIEQAQAAAVADRHRAAVAELLRVSSELNAGHSTQRMLQDVTMGIADALGFEKVATYLLEDDELMRPCAEVGWNVVGGVPMREVPVSGWLPLVGAEHLQEGCALIDGETADRIAPPEVPRVYSSSRSGAGAGAWRDHWLLVPLFAPDGAMIGMIWPDEPVDRMLPSREQLQALRLFADLAVSALEAAGRLEHMRRLAEHDSLTGLPNRRGLEAFLGGTDAEGWALLVFDLDHFKRINDQLGHTAGDEALVRFADVLRGALRDSDLAVRLGGEEFAVVLPHAGISAGHAVAERVRRRTHDAFADFPRALTVSVGVSAGAASHGRLREADRALYAAKRSGRDRTVVYRPDTTDALIHELGEEGSADQLGAVLLLAETLDLRDEATARHSRTVGRYAQETGRRLGLEPHRVERLRIAGVLHDIGKIGVSDEILRKPGKLDAAEWADMRRHPGLGARILANAGLHDVAGWVLAHHERIDGAGYPAGLAGDDIPLEARVLAVADAFEAMIADRPYRRAMAHEAALAELERCAGSQFDPEVVAAFLACAAEPLVAA